MKPFLKQHWPAVLSAMIWAICLINPFALGLDDTDSYGFIILVSGLLFPLCAFIACLWYASRINSPLKWLLIPLFALLGTLALTGWDLRYSNLTQYLLTGIPAAAGLVIGSLIRWRKRRQ